MFKLKNLAKGTLSTQLLSGGGTFSLQSGEGAKFPDTGSDNVFVGVFWSNSFASPEADSNAEFVTSYRTSGDAFSVTRAQEGTSAHQWEIGDNFSLVASSAVFSELNETKVTKADSSSDNAIVKFDGVDGDTIQNSGVFIGDDNTLAVNGPNTNVSINGANVTGGLGVWVDDGGTNKAGIGIGKADSTSALAGATYYGARSRGTLSTPEIIENGDLMTAMVGLGYDGSTFRLGSRINQEVDGTPGSADMPGRITFHTTADGAIVPTERMRIDKTGNVGFGTDNPVAKVDVASGNIKIDTTTGATPYGIIYKGSSPFIHNFNYGLNGNGITTDGGNTFIGINAGNFSMGSTATQTYHASSNTGIGQSALTSNTTGYYNSAIGVNALYFNTTGPGNSAIGREALYSNTTGSNNSAIGVNALRNNTTGHSNFAIGRDALLSNTTGYYNSAIGMYALRNNTTGFSNYAIGVSAGRYLADGSANQTSSNSLFLGNDTRASVAGGSNEIVIGDSAIGLGSNTVVLGNSSITTTRLQGNIGNVDSPSARLHIRGAGATSSTTGLLVENSGGTANLTIRDDGAFAFRGGTVGLAQSGYAVSNVTTDRTYDADATTLDEIADVLGTLIADLKSKAIITA